MSENETCERCGSPLELPTSGGAVLCARCLARGLAPDCGDDTLSDAPAMSLPRVFGAYELTEEIGRGGMGVVYRARQLTLDRTVAVKLLLAGAYSSEATLRRFRLEAAAAARLQHSNIVPIHDYGECDGQPFYVMDLIAGRDLAVVCGGRPLETRRAVGLVAELARAVQYAHEAGIVHRDLKPSNVLIEPAGDRPRITDFGLARRLDHEDGVTLTGQVVGSPSYAAPEQLAGRGDEVGVATDVYGIGALCYHLVTGRAPFNAAASNETMRLVLETDPPPPRLLNPGLPRELETIVLKCLEKAPARRYSSAAELSEDLDRFLTQRPIRARPPSVLYRARKFARRHRSGVAATAITMVALVVGLGVALAGFRRAVIQQHAAVAARHQGESLISFMADDLRPGLEDRGTLQLRKGSAEAAIRYYESLPDESRDVTTDQAYATVLEGAVWLRFDSGDQAGAQQALRVALDLRRTAATRNPGDPDIAWRILRDEWWIPTITSDETTRSDEAFNRETVRRARELRARFPENYRVKRWLATALTKFAYRARRQFHGFFQWEDAIAAATEAVALFEELARENPDEVELPDSKRKVPLDFMDPFQMVGTRERKVQLTQQARDAEEAAFQADPGNITIRSRLAIREYHLMWTRDRSPISSREGWEFARSAFEHFRILTELDPTNRLWRCWLATTHAWECDQLAWVDGSIAPTREAWKKLDGMWAGLEAYEEVPWRRWDAAYVRALFAALAGDADEARALFDEGRGRFDFWYGRLPERSLPRCLALAEFRRFEEAVAMFLRDWRWLEQSARDGLDEIEAAVREYPANDALRLSRAITRQHLGRALLRQGDAAEAIAILQQALSEFRDVSKAQPIRDAGWPHDDAAMEFLAEALAQVGELPPARELLETALIDREAAHAAPNANWLSKESLANTRLLLAGLLDPAIPAEAERRRQLLDSAWTLLATPEAEGRITLDGRETMAKLTSLRSEVTTSAE